MNINKKGEQMLIAQTKEKLAELKLAGFIDVLDELISPNQHDLSLMEALGLMVDRELITRRDKRLSRLLKTAKLRYNNACVENIDYKLPRKFNHEQLRALTNCDWIRNHRNIVFMGATGVGKSYIACALAHQACQMQFSCRYYRTARLLEALNTAHADGSYHKQLEQLSKINLLVLDDWGIDQLDRTARRDLLEIFEDRYQRQSTIITSQLPIDSWHPYIGDDTIADAICDRVLTQSYKIEITGESIRKATSELTSFDQ